jgi:hypothetical protein
MSIRPMIATHSAIRQLLARFYPEDNVEPTLMAAGFDPSETLAFSRPDDSLGSTTRAVGPPALPQSQLDRIERAIADLRKMVTTLQERIDTIEQSLDYLSSRR